MLDVHSFTGLSPLPPIYAVAVIKAKQNEKKKKRGGKKGRRTDRNNGKPATERMVITVA